jgi:hypothetical protein
MHRNSLTFSDHQSSQEKSRKSEASVSDLGALPDDESAKLGSIKSNHDGFPIIVEENSPLKNPAQPTEILYHSFTQIENEEGSAIQNATPYLKTETKTNFKSAEDTYKPYQAN